MISENYTYFESIVREATLVEDTKLSRYYTFLINSRLGYSDIHDRSNAAEIIERFISSIGFDGFASEVYIAYQKAVKNYTGMKNQKIDPDTIARRYLYQYLKLSIEKFVRIEKCIKAEKSFEAKEDCCYIEYYGVDDISYIARIQGPRLDLSVIYHIASANDTKIKNISKRVGVSQQSYKEIIKSDFIKNIAEELSDI